MIDSVTLPTRPTAAARRPAHEPLVAIQAGQRGAVPLFCIAGAGASVSSFFDLSVGLPASLPLYGLQARGVEGSDEPYASVEEAAEAFVQAIRKTRPTGPYRLLGHSFGGWIAFEVACRLEAQGQAVERLYIVDSRGPDTDPTPRHIDRAAALDLLVGLYNLALPHPVRLPAGTFQRLDEHAQLRVLHRELVASGLFHPNNPVQTLEGVVRVFHRNVDTRYLPAWRRRGHTCLVNAVEGEPDRERHLAHWSQLAPAVGEVLLPGNHITMLSGPHGRAFGHWLGEDLARTAPVTATEANGSTR
jgi:thioesterase domain-containing protein